MLIETQKVQQKNTLHQFLIAQVTGPPNRLGCYVVFVQKEVRTFTSTHFPTISQ